MTALELDLVGRVVERLREEVAEEGLTVEAALVLGPPPKPPAAIVYLAGDELSESAAPTVGAIQRVSATLAVVHVVAARNTARGGPAIDPLARLAGVTRGVLNGWKPSDRRDVLQLRRGRLLDLAEGQAVWQDEYTISWRASRVPDQ